MAGQDESEKGRWSEGIGKERDLFSRHDSERAIWLEYAGNAKGDRVSDVRDIGVREFEGDGDFRSAECVELLTQADIVVTNPPVKTL